MIKTIRLLIGGILLALGFVIIDKKDLLDIVNMIKEEIREAEDGSN